ncbi:hypothetical protein KP509_22G058200 [Ceratopteris richardii]|uniref:Uncharacterized protein n=1 Tax=Ceratopteris richardii TaxID=49495 RepID=A0A8T2S7J2_CERRI|nr:hypothetical protein KP509_22G058200 [Ceratopteris richardii]
MTDKGKRAKVDEEEGSEPIDTELVDSIQKLQEVQDELEKVNEEASDKVLEVEQKYNEVRRPIYSKRNEIIQGIPDFWLTAFLSHPALCELLNEEDQQVFKYLQSLDVEDFKDVKSGYSIIFTFKQNPYFEDNQLVKVYRFSDDGTTSVSGTQPRWKDGMDFTNGVVEKAGNKRPPSDESFFKWFTDTDNKDSMAHDEIADIIKEDLWPNPLKYFNNEGDDDDDEFEDEDAEDDDNDDDDQGNGADEDGEEEPDEEEDDEDE